MEFRVLGPVELWAGGRAWHLGPPQQRHTLAALVVDAGRPVSTEALIDRIWDVAPATADQAVRVHISRIRQLLNQVGIASGASVGVVRRSGGYLLDVPPALVDLHRFGDLARLANTPGAGGPPVQPLREARALWRGEPLAGLNGQWATRSRQAWSQQFLDMTVAWAQAEILAGVPEAAIGPLTELATENPFAESLVAVLMRALVAAGRPAEALTHYARARERLIGELGVDPSAELQAVYLAILRSDRGSPLVTAAPFAAAAVSRVPTQLPADVVGFAGRDECLARLDEVLTGAVGTSATAVVISAVCGTAGVGKTALAVHWAHRVAERFPDGQLYVNLNGFAPGREPSDPADAIRGFLDAFHLDPYRIPATLDAQAALYRSLLTDKRILILLDNARDSDHVRHLLPGAPGCVVVVTSRNQLTGLVATHAAHPVTLDLLTTHEATELLVNRLGATRVSAEPRAVDEIVSFCARLPLALAIVAAAAQQCDFALSTLADGLRDVTHRLDALDAGDSASRIRAVFSWSTDALTPAAARLFRLLSLHPGPDVAIPAAASLAGHTVAETRRLLTELTRGSLLTESVRGRFTWHDLLRAYATDEADRVDSDESRRAAAVRLLDHYVHTAYAAERLLYPAWDPITLTPAHTAVVREHLVNHHQALDWFSAEHRVLLAVVERAAADGMHAHIWQLAWALRTFLSRRGHWHDQIAVGRAAVTAAGCLAEPAVRAHAHRNLAYAYIQLSQSVDAHTELEQALDLATRTGDRLEQAHVHNTLALLWARQDHPVQALDEARSALRLFQDVGHQGGRASALNGIGWYHLLLGHPQETLPACRQARSLYQQVGDRTGQAIAQDILGGAHHHLGHHAVAIACYQDALSLFRDLGDRCFEGAILAQLGDTQHATGNLHAARRAWHQALAIFAELQLPDADKVRAKLDGLSD